MSEYNIQMNKYNASNAGYDQLYPQPMKHANTHAKDGNDSITPSMIGTYNKTEIDTALQKKADTSSVYTKSESISASTRTALGLAQTATPDAALAEIAQRLSEIDLLWTNASPSSSFQAQNIAIPTGYDIIAVEIVERGFWFSSRGSIAVQPFFTYLNPNDPQVNLMYRQFKFTDGNIEFREGKIQYGGGELQTANQYMIPLHIYGIKGIE